MRRVNKFVIFGFQVAVSRWLLTDPETDDLESPWVVISC